MDQQYERRIGECDVKLDNCKARIKDQKNSGEDRKALDQRLKDLNGVRSKLVKEQNAS
jgi:hypothetical protein